MGLRQSLKPMLTAVLIGVDGVNMGEKLLMAKIRLHPVTGLAAGDSIAGGVAAGAVDAINAIPTEGVIDCILASTGWRHEFGRRLPAVEAVGSHEGGELGIGQGPFAVRCFSRVVIDVPYILPWVNA
jgi:hypothetical protein